MRAHQHHQIVGEPGVPYDLVRTLRRLDLDPLEYSVDIVEEHVRPQGTDHRSLRYSALPACLQDPLAQPEQVIVLHSSRELRQQEVVPHRVEVALEIEIDDLVQLLQEPHPHTFERSLCANVT